jgi:hypothetical protein
MITLKTTRRWDIVIIQFGFNIDDVILAYPCCCAISTIMTCRTFKPSDKLFTSNAFTHLKNKRVDPQFFLSLILLTEQKKIFIIV